MEKTSVKQRRSSVEILMEILNLIENGRETKTAIVYGANLNFTVAKKYIQLLVEKGLVKVEDKSRGKKYSLTEKGKKFLREYEGIREVLG
jgi:predicted transcriptional regulator